jgi:hypothetical protein
MVDRTRTGRQDPVGQGRRSQCPAGHLWQRTGGQQESQGRAGWQSQDAAARGGSGNHGTPGWGRLPFGLATPLPIYCDVALRAFEEVVPAAGSTHAAIRINPIRLAELVDAKWVDVCEQQE